MIWFRKSKTRQLSPGVMPVCLSEVEQLRRLWGLDVARSRAKEPAPDFVDSNIYRIAPPEGRIPSRRRRRLGLE